MGESEVITATAVAHSPAHKKKSTKTAKAKPLHPKTAVMVPTAIKNLKERGGSSLQAIKKYIVANYKVDAEKLAPFIKKYLKGAVAAGSLVQTKGKGASGSFKIASGEKVKKTVAGATKKPKTKKVVKKKVIGAKKKASKKSVGVASAPSVATTATATAVGATTTVKAITKKAAAAKKAATKSPKKPKSPKKKTAASPKATKAKKTKAGPTKKLKAPKPKTTKFPKAKKTTAAKKK